MADRWYADQVGLEWLILDDDDNDTLVVREIRNAGHAHLIAAAPDLLAACKAWLAIWNSNRDIDRVVKQCELLEQTEKAIAKAEGRE